MVVAGVLAGWAGPAAAHASVVSSFPAQGARVRTAPATVSVVFDQPVRPDKGGLVVLNSTGAVVSSGGTHPSPTTLQAGLPASLGAGSYVANYTVTSVDGHVVSGGIVFLVGNATAGQIAQVTRTSSSFTGAVDKTGQFLIYLGVLASAGLAFFLAFVLTAGPERVRLRRWCLGAAVVGVIGMAVTGAAQVALTGGGWGAIGHWSVIRQALGGKFGGQSVLQLVGLAACLWSVRIAVPVLANQLAAFYGTLLSAGAFVVFGHAIAGRERWLSVPADVVHAVFAALWLGGLTGLVVVLRTRTRAARVAGELASFRLRRSDVAGEGAGGVTTSPTPRRGSATALLERTATIRVGVRVGNGRRHANGSEDTTGPSMAAGDGSTQRDGSVLSSTVGVVSRFSTMAGVSLTALVAAGVLLAVAEVGSITNLFDSGYGQILLVKIALVGLLAVVAGYNRLLLLPGLFRGVSDRSTGRLCTGWRRLLSTVRVEALGVVAVLAVTAVLANSTPSNSSTVIARPVPFAQTQPFEGGHISLRITPNQALVNDFVVQFTGPDGAPADKAETVSAYLTLPSQNVGPIITDMQKAGVGKFVLTDTPAPPILGSWQITLQIQVSPFDEPTASFVDQVR